MQRSNSRCWKFAPVLTGCLLIAGIGCNQSSLEAKGIPDIIVTKADHDRTVKATTGRQVTVKLAWSPSTGYDWVLTRNDPSMLKQEGDAKTEPAKQPMPGAAETRVFTFKALKAGSSTLEFHFRRSFEKDAPDQGVFKVK